MTDPEPSPNAASQESAVGASAVTTSAASDVAAATDTYSSAPVAPTPIAAATSTTTSDTLQTSLVRLEIDTDLKSSAAVDPSSSKAAQSGSAAAAAASEKAPSSSAVHNRASSKVDPGALAGGIVGAFFGGFILALMAAFLFNRRRIKGSNRRDLGHKSIESAHRTPKRHSRERHEMSPVWERLIPQPVDDETMGNATKSLLDQVALHVDNFYARKTLQISPSKLEPFAKMDTGLLTGPIAELMMDADMQLPVIKHCIAFILTAKMMPGVDASDKLLPLHLALVPHKLAPDSSDEKEVLGALQAYSVWRTLTSYLLPELADDSHTASRRQQVTTSMVNEISEAFKDWEKNSPEGTSAAAHFAKIAGAAYDVGVRIASQASSYKFEWQQRRRQGVEHARHLVVLPGFLKVVDETGHPLDSPQVLVRPITQRLRQGR